MAIELISKIKQKNKGEFFLVDAADIDIKSGNEESSYPNTSLSAYIDGLDATIGDENSGLVKDVADLKDMAVPVPQIADSGKYLRVNNAGEWIIQDGNITGDGDIIMPSNTLYSELISDGTESAVTVAIENNTVTSIQGYKSVTLIKPDALDDMPIWECAFYIHFANEKGVSLTLPSGMRCNGDSPNYVKPGDVWEISINKQGGAVCLRT